MNFSWTLFLVSFNLAEISAWWLYPSWIVHYGNNLTELSTEWLNLHELSTGWLLTYVAELSTWWLNLPELFTGWLLT